MIAEQPLTVIALIAAIVSMVLSSIALWPKWKHGLAVVRDVVLWVALAFFVVLLINGRARRAAETDASHTSQSVFQNAPTRPLPVQTVPIRGSSGALSQRYAPAHSSRQP